MSYVTNRFWTMAGQARRDFDKSRSEHEASAACKEIALDRLYSEWCGAWFDDSAFASTTGNRK